LALLAVCLFWGTTYLAIRISLEGLPPLYLIAIRYLISGSLLLIVIAASQIAIPRGRELWLTAGCGIVCIGIGNGFLAIAETYIPSGLAALFFTTAPFWMVALDALLPHGKKPLAATILALLVGLSGVVYLIYPAMGEGFHGKMQGGKTMTGFFLLQASAAGWVLGSLLQKRVQSKSMPFVSGAVQQLAAGLAMFLPAALTEHLPAHIALRPLLAMAYLVVFGSILGFSAFIYSVARLPVAIASIYSFVNPIVAVFLGWLFFREPFGIRGVIAMFIIFAGVALVRRSERHNTQLTLAAGHKLG
jgi:drug/metabolite transporter (DMT)-like permease